MKVALQLPNGYLALAEDVDVDDREAFLKARHGPANIGVGASDMAAVCNHSTFLGSARNIGDVFAAVIGRLDPDFVHEDLLRDNEHIQRGVKYEPLARAAYESASGYEVRDPKMWRIESPDTTLSEDVRTQMLRCSPDGLVFRDVSPYKFLHPVEFKCPAQLRTNSVPLNHLFQLQWQMFTLNAPYADYFAIYDIQELEDGTYHLKYLALRVKRSDIFIQAMLSYVTMLMRAVSEMNYTPLGLRPPRGPDRIDAAQWRNLVGRKESIDKLGEGTLYNFRADLAKGRTPWPPGHDIEWY